MVMRITAKTRLCIIIGDPVEHSLSPQMHNAGYEALGIAEQFVFVASRVERGRIKEAVEAMRTLNFRGMTCTMPHKKEVIAYLDEVEESARMIEAVNTIVQEDGILRGSNTDWIGAITALEQHISLDGKSVAILGAGGAGRAMAYGVAQKGARFTIFHREEDALDAQEIAEKFGGQQKGLSSISEVAQADIIMNATPVGMAPAFAERSLVPKEAIRPHHIVFDAVYSPLETRLLREAKERGAQTICGVEMLLYQGVTQFERYVGQRAPIDAMRRAITEVLAKRKAV
ncbi:MAG: shikimate dehydrogenase [Patescibacteria group bacterium]